MSDNTATVRGIYAAFSRGDVPAIFAVMAPDIQWTEAEGFPYGGVYVGSDAIVSNVFMPLGTEWDGFAAAPGEFVAQGDTVVVLGTYSGKYRATGKSFKAPFAHVWKLRDGKVQSLHQHTDTAVVQRALR
jgi:ketosteroid isomerase-like protein